MRHTHTAAAGCFLRLCQGMCAAPAPHALLLAWQASSCAHAHASPATERTHPTTQQSAHQEAGSIGGWVLHRHQGDLKHLGAGRQVKLRGSVTDVLGVGGAALIQQVSSARLFLTICWVLRVRTGSDKRSVSQQHVGREGQRVETSESVCCARGAIGHSNIKNSEVPTHAHPQPQALN